MSHAAIPSALVFDRASMVAETVAVVLSYAGYEAHFTETYRDARRVFDALPQLDLIIIHADKHGEHRGRSLLDAALRERPGMAMIIVSSRPPQDIGAIPPSVVFLEKPFDREQLLDAVERAKTARPFRSL